MSEVDTARVRLARADITASELAEIAQKHPPLRVLVAAHPNAYPELLTWLAGRGDPAVDAVLVARVVPTSDAPPPPPSTQPSTTPTASEAPMPTPHPGMVSVHLSHPWLAFAYALCRPVISLDGQQVATGWGMREVALRGARQELSVVVPYLGMRAGRASTTVTVDSPRQLEYRAPYIVTMRGELGVTARARGGWIVALLVGLPLLVVIGTLIVVGIIAASLDNDQSATPAAPAADATWFEFRPTDAGLDDEIVAATARLFERRLASSGTEAEVAVDGKLLRVEFAAAPSQAVVSALIASTNVEFRPVLVVQWFDVEPARDPATATPPQFTDDPNRPAGPSSPSDAEYYVTDAIQWQLDTLDCTGYGTATAAALDAALVACAADGTSKFVLGPVEIEGIHLAQVSVGHQVLSNGATARDLALTLTLDHEGTTQMAQATERLAVQPPPLNQFAMVAGGKVISAPAVNSAISAGELELSGGNSEDWYYDTAVALGLGRPGMTWQLTSSGS